MSARYVDLDDSQKKALRTRLSGLHAWHRTQELPLYADLLDQTADRINRHLSPADMTWMAHSIHERRRAGAAAVAQELTPLLLTLSPAQEAQIAEAMARTMRASPRPARPQPAARSGKERNGWQDRSSAGPGSSRTISAKLARLFLDADFPAARLAERQR
jgi:hypothetical protein